MEKIENVEETIISILEQYADGFDPATLKPDTNIKNDLGLDSLAVVEMVLDVEVQFDVEIPDEEAESMTTFGDIVEYVKKLQEG